MTIRFYINAKNKTKNKKQQEKKSQRQGIVILFVNVFFFNFCSLHAHHQDHLFVSENKVRAGFLGRHYLEKQTGINKVLLMFLLLLQTA